MALTFRSDIKTGVPDLIVDKIDIGTTNSNGRLILKTSADAEVATLEFSNPAFSDTDVSGVATANAITPDSNATGGEVDRFDIVDCDVSVVLDGTVTVVGGGGDIEISTTTILANATVSVSSLTMNF